MIIEKQITRDDFMSFFRDTESLNQLSMDDRIEVFKTVLLGSSCFKKELFDELFSDYSVNHLDVIEIDDPISKPKINVESSMLKARVDKLTDLYDFTQNICALSEMKEVDHGKSKADLKLSMCDTWDTVTECAINFVELHKDTEWDGEWYEALEEYYQIIVRPLIFEI